MAFYSGLFKLFKNSFFIKIPDIYRKLPIEIQKHPPIYFLSS